jgi:hypothetical protein
MYKQRDQAIYVYGNPVDGLKFVGPFKDEEDARDYKEFSGDPWVSGQTGWAANLEGPRDWGSLTLDDAEEAFSAGPSAFTAATYLATAAEYFKDGMIEPGTFMEAVRKVQHTIGWIGGRR